MMQKYTGTRKKQWKTLSLDESHKRRYKGSTYLLTFNESENRVNTPNGSWQIKMESVER